MLETLTLTLPIESLYILSLLQKNGFEGYIVGGAVRDTLQAAFENKPLESIKKFDYDFTTSAKPEEIQKLFPEHYYENIYGTVGVAKEHLLVQMGRQDIHSDETIINTQQKTIDLSQATKVHSSLQSNDSQESKPAQNKEVFEITTYRYDGTYTDHRKPEQVTWGSSLFDDLERRDFTINALAIQINQEYLQTIDFATAPAFVSVSNTDFTLIDKHNGLADLQENLIQTVGDPNTRFTEDALRMLRALRFSVQLNMQIEPKTFTGIIENSQLLEHVSYERIRDEFLKMLSSEFPKQAIELLDETNLLSFILPELLEAKGVNQGGHHTTDVWTHSLDALDACPSSDPIVRLATLLHDIAKPATYKLINGSPTFYNHEIVGSRMAKKIAIRLRLSKRETERIFLLVRFHMFYYQPENTDASIRRFMRKVGLENINDILDLREADRLGSGARKTSWRLEEMKQRMVEQLNQPFAITDLEINGHDLINTLGLSPGPQIGTVLAALFEEVLDNPELNTKEILLEKARGLIEKN